MHPREPTPSTINTKTTSDFALDLDEQALVRLSNLEPLLGADVRPVCRAGLY